MKATGRTDWIAENHLLVFKPRDTLYSVFISARSERCLHACSRIRVVLNTEARSESMSTTGADEARIVESHHDHDSIAHDPFIDGAQRNLTVQIRLIVESACPNRSFETHSGSSHADAMTIANTETS